MKFTNNGKFDWNGNGKKDAFDEYMNMKVSGMTEDNSKSKVQSNSNKPTNNDANDSNGTIIFKSIVATLICVGGIALSVAIELGTLGSLIILSCAIVISLIILKSGSEE